MIFSTKTDIEQRIPAQILAQITGGDDTRISTAETQAIGIITDLLSGNYDTTAEFAKTDTDRHASLLMWTVSLTCYYLYAHIADTQTPDRIVKDYDDTLKSLSNIALGKLPTTLAPLLNDNGTTKRVVRFGFNQIRNHELL